LAGGERREDAGIKEALDNGLPFDVAELTRSWRHNNRDVSTFRSLAVQSLATGAFVRSSILMVIRQRMDDDAVRMYEWFDRVGFAVDRAALRREFPDVAFHDFESWAKTRDWNALLQSA
jgi:hypothetical protein